MKIRNHYFILTIFIGILCIPAFGKVELPLHESRPLLIAPANRPLAGIENLHVVILPYGAEPNEAGLFWNKLEAEVASKLSKAGIKIAAAIGGNILEIPELRIHIGMLKLDDSQRYVFHIQTSLASKVSLVTQSQRYTKADLWKVRPTMQAVSVQAMPVKVTEEILKQAEAFITAYLIANPPGRQPSNVNNIRPSPRKRVKLTAKPNVVEYKYVASKNSKVFHKPDCIFVKKIKPKNLVGYHTRAEAVKAGKRPCKQCKP